MSSKISDPEVAAAIDRCGASIGVLLADDWVPSGCEEAMVRIRETEALSRQLHAFQLSLIDRIGRSGVFKADGHASAKVMVRHGANLSNAEALRRDQVVRMQRDMPHVATDHASGRVGTSQVERIARTWANTRVRDRLIEVDAQMARAALMLPYPEFDAALSDWERLTDEDGAGDQAERNEANRDFRMPQTFDGSRRIEGAGGSVSGQVIEDIWRRQVKREWEADWAEARRAFGDAATKDDLSRTDPQRRYDAMKTCMIRGDLGEYGVEARTCTELVIDEVTFDRHVAKLFGTDPAPDPRLVTWWDDLLDAFDADSNELRTDDLVGHRCGTIDGRPLDPTEVVVATLIGQIRRVVIGADSVVLDMGRKARCFTGARQVAVRLASSSCIWTACEVPSSECQSDHLDAFHGSGEGRTCPDNGGPACGRHNRFKEKGFTIVRDDRGRYHVLRPDGTEIT